MSYELGGLVGARLVLPPPSFSSQDLLRKPFIKRHTQDFIADVVSRPEASIGEGTMAVRVAAVNVAAASGSGGRNGSAISVGGNGAAAGGGGAMAMAMANRDAEALKKQLESLQLQDVIANALAPKERPTSPRAAEKVAREQAGALKREEDRKKARRRDRPRAGRIDAAAVTLSKSAAASSARAMRSDLILTHAHP